MFEKLFGSSSAALLEGFGHFPCDGEMSVFIDEGKGGKEPFGAFKSDCCTGKGECFFEDIFPFFGQKADELKAARIEAGEDEGLNDAARAGDSRYWDALLNTGVDEDLAWVVDAGGTCIGDEPQRFPIFELLDDPIERLFFFEFVVGDEFFLNGKMVEQFQAMAGIFAQDGVARSEGIFGPLGKISQMANRGGNYVQQKIYFIID